MDSYRGREISTPVQDQKEPGAGASEAGARASLEERGESEWTAALKSGWMLFHKNRYLLYDFPRAHNVLLGHERTNRANMPATP